MGFSDSVNGTTKNPGVLDFGFANVNGPHMKYELGMYQHLDLHVY